MAILSVKNGDEWVGIQALVGPAGPKGDKGDTGATGPSGAAVEETVTGTTPSINAVANHRYVCGEVSTLSFTPCQTGICDVVFESGSTATVLTVPSTVKWPDWFNPASLEANAVYEINILNGTLGAVMLWT